MRLKDLPVKLTDFTADDSVSETYVAERNAVKSIEDLEAFVARWKAVWAIEDVSKRSHTAEEVSLVQGTFNSEEVLACILKHRGRGECEHTKPSCCGMHVTLPVLLLNTYLISKKYGLPTDPALIQICGGWEALES